VNSDCSSAESTNVVVFAVMTRHPRILRENTSVMKLT
jgi:hypothetical protein